MSANGNGSSYSVHMAQDTFPACNAHTFIFSNPFLESSKVVQAVNSAGDRATFPPIPAHKPIFYDPRTSAAITHSRLRYDTLRLAHGIRKRFGPPRTTGAFGSGSSAGPVVLIHLPNSILWPVILLGFMAAGWTVTATNPGYTSGEVARVVKQCEPRVIVCYPRQGGEDVIREACVAANHSNTDFILVDPDDDVYGAARRPPGRESWTELLSDQELELVPFSVDEANRRVALILWTSGTTGTTKGAMISHRALVAGLVQHWHLNTGYSPDERWIAVAPFYHIFGMYNQLLLAPCIGATVTILAVKQFNLEEYLRLASAFKATQLHIAPPVGVALSKTELISQPWCSLESVVAITSGGAPLAPEIVRDVWDRLGLLIKMGYGLTEAGGVATTKGDTWDATVSQLGSCGIPQLGVRITVIDETGKLVPRGTHGELVVRSPAQMLGYLKNKQATAETLDEKGLHTGDVGYIDEAGNIRIVDRLKELIKYKGFQVSPTELEAIITSLPDVQDAAVSSTYSHMQGTELPLAYVVPRSPPLPSSGGEIAALAEKVKLAIEQNCIHYKRLRGGVTFVPAIPKSPSGKILRRLLKDQKGVHIDCYKTTGQNKL